MFGRNQDKTSPSAPPSTAEGTEGKGRPTPSRKQAEAERKDRLRASSSGSSRRQRASSAAATRSERADTRKRIIAGDESVLAARDRGPERRYARDLVDERHTVGEYFLYAAIFVLILGLIRIPALAFLSQALLLLIVLALVVDSVRTHRRVSRAVKEKFPNSTVEGIGRYAMMRAMVTRRMRVPGPQVTRRRRGATS